MDAAGKIFSKRPPVGPCSEGASAPVTGYYSAGADRFSPVRERERKKSVRELSIVFPSYNEAARLPGTLDSVLAFCREELDRFELIVVDDGSSDDTEAVVREFEDVRYLRNEVNRGKGETVKRGMLAAELDTVLFSDGDLSTPIEETLSLMQAIEEGADVAIGSRRFDGEKQVRRSWPRRLMAWGWRTVVHFLVLKGIHDTQCGFKMFRRGVAREVLALQRLEGWAFDVEVLFLVRRLGYSIAEVPVEWHESGESRLGFFSPFRMALDLLRVRRLHGDLRKAEGESGES